jgi:Ca-activated chloride channel family protein
VEALSAQGYRLSIIGVGSRDGAPVPLAGGGFLQDQSGAVVIAAYDDRLLRQLAEQGGGSYQAMTLDDSDIQAVMQLLATELSSNGVSEDRFQADVWHEQGPWLVLLLLPLALMVFRRGYLLLVLALFFPMHQHADAWEWRDMWLTRDQQAARQFEAGDYDVAAKHFKHRDWQASAHYKAGDFETVVDILDTADDARSLYAKGNALGQLGRYEEALDAYNRSLALMPDNEDARHNLQLVQEALAQQQRQENQQDGDQQDGDQQDGDQQDGEQQDGDQQDGEQQQGGEQQQDGEQRSMADQDDEQQQDGEQRSMADQDDEQQQDGEQSSMAEQGDEQQDGEQSSVADQGDEQQQDGEQSSMAEQGDEQQQDGEQPLMADKDDLTDEANDPQGSTSTMQMSEKMQATEQWLRRIPDDPGGLLKRKFQHQYQQRDGNKR